MMREQSEKTAILDRLYAISDTFGDDTAVLTEEYRTRLSAVTSRLAAPARVVIAGQRDSEHGMLAEFILGSALFDMPTDADIYPPIRVRYGNEPRTFALCGSSRHGFVGCRVDAAATTDNVAMIDLELPNGILSRLGFLVFASCDGDEQKIQQLFQIFKMSDIVVWCSNASTPWSGNEARLWDNVSDRLKDRSVLALTGADLVATDQDRVIFDRKCDAAAADFQSMVSISVPAARAAAPNGAVVDGASFSASGGQNLLKEILGMAKDHEVDLMAEARTLLAELSSLQEEDAKRKKIAKSQAVESDLMSLLSEDDNEEAFEFLLDPPNHADVRAALEKNVVACKAALDQATENGYAPLFEAMVELLDTLRGHLRAGLKLTAEHHQVATQLDEAEELVGLLSYECDEKSAAEAADIVRQVSTDLWTRLPSDHSFEIVKDHDELTSNVSNSEQELGVSAA
jgi:hypothetical protein